MNLNSLKSAQTVIDELCPLTRTFERENCQTALLGLIRQGQELSSWEEWAPPCRRPVSGLRTNRKSLRLAARTQPPQSPMQGLRSVCWGEQNLEVKSVSTSTIGNEWTNILLLSEFVRAGFRAPGSMAETGFDRLLLTKAEFAGSFDSIPQVRQKAPLRLTFQDAPRTYTARKKLTLPIGGARPRGYLCRSGQRETRFYINRVYLLNLQAEMEEVMQSAPAFLALAPAEREQFRRGFSERCAAVCPEGTLLPVVEYETEPGASLQLYLRSWLDAAPDSTGMGVRLKPDEERGPHGLPLKAHPMQIGVVSDATELELELLGWMEEGEKYVIEC